MYNFLSDSLSGVQTGSLSVGDLMRFSHQVAQGLDFLSTRNVRAHTFVFFILYFPRSLTVRDVFP